MLSQTLIRDLQLDSSSVFATGHSNGADMCYFLALQPETFVRAIAPVAGTMMHSWQNYFPVQNRISVMETHGT